MLKTKFNRKIEWSGLADAEKHFLMSSDLPLVENTASGHEGGVNTSDLADPMIIAIMTSRREKRAKAQNFRKWLKVKA